MEHRDRDSKSNNASLRNLVPPIGLLHLRYAVAAADYGSVTGETPLLGGKIMSLKRRT
jgi:hypothetical protein